MVARIKKAAARAILDSRGIPTVEVELETQNGCGRASVPSGASKSSFEALELRDGGKKFFGYGVSKAVASVNGIIGPKLRQTAFSGQTDFDEFLISLDGTKNKSKLGANAILACSLAFSRCLACESGTPLYASFSKVRRYCLPVPFFNVINGGAHAGNSIAFQEYLIAPVGAKTFAEAAQYASEIYHALRGLISRQFGRSATNVGDEGGFAPPLSDVATPLELVSRAIGEVGLQGKVSIALDVAATSFFDGKKYAIGGGKRLGPGEYFDFVEGLAKTHRIISVEDPFCETDFAAFSKFTRENKAIQVVGDDLLSTNPVRIARGVQTGACNCLLLKPNQIGTLAEAVRAANLAYGAGWGVMVSHRSGETEDTFIADLAVGLGCGQIKLGACARGERTAKINQLIRIEGELGSNGKFAGREFHRPARRLGFSL